MKKSLIDVLACPICKGDLQLRVSEERDDGEVITGELYCPKCSYPYPIKEGIPNLLPPQIGAQYH